MLNCFGSIPKHILQSSFDGKLQDIAATCLYTIHLMNAILVDCYWLCGVFEGCCWSQTLKRERVFNYPVDRKLPDVQLLYTIALIFQ